MSQVAPLQLSYHLERRLENLRNGKREVKLKKKPQLEWHLKNMKPKSHECSVRNEFAVKPATYSATIVTDIPLYETPGALFDEYLEDKPRVFNAMFPHRHSIQQLYEDEWRIKMMPSKVMALKMWPVIDFRLKCKYPPQVPSDITKLLEIQSTRFELQGLDKVIDPSSHFALGVKATLYPDRRGNKSRIRGDTEINISLVFPPAVTFIPGGAICDILVRGVMAEIGERIKVAADDGLLADYRNFRKERSDSRRHYFTKI